MKSARRRTSATTIVRAVGGLAVLSVLSGLLVSIMALTVTGVAGFATKNAAATFDNLSVPTFAQLPARSEILDARGRLIAYYYPNHIYRVPLSYSQIAPSMRDAHRRYRRLALLPARRDRRSRHAARDRRRPDRRPGPGRFDAGAAVRQERLAADCQRQCRAAGGGCRRSRAQDPRTADRRQRRAPADARPTAGRLPERRVLRQ